MDDEDRIIDGTVDMGADEVFAGCSDDSDCPDDGNYCNGDEVCVTGTCVSNGDPCPDDGLYCNGTESCDEVGDQCLSSGDPCSDDGTFCNGTESCDEAGDQCVAGPDHRATRARAVAGRPYCWRSENKGETDKSAGHGANSYHHYDPLTGSWTGRPRFDQQTSPFVK